MNSLTRLKTLACQKIKKTTWRPLSTTLPLRACRADGHMPRSEGLAELGLELLGNVWRTRPCAEFGATLDNRGDHLDAGAALFGLRASTDRLQLVPQPTLPQLPE